MSQKEFYVKKRTGECKLYDKSKIYNAIKRAIISSYRERKINFDNDTVNTKVCYLTKEVESSIFSTENFKIEKDNEKEFYYINIEDIQDIVEDVLIKQCEDPKIAKCYILYRNNHSDIRLNNKLSLDIEKTMDGYLNDTDWRVRENASINYSIGGLILHNSGSITANYWLNKIYPKYIKDAHKDGDFHIHDLSMLSGYCFTGDTKVKLIDGTAISLKELAETKQNEEFYVFSRNKDNEIVPAKAIYPRLIEKNAKLVAVTLDNNEIIRCTPDHEFILLNGDRKEAKDLTSKDRLSPLHMTMSNSGYLMIKNKNKIQYIHRMIADYFFNENIDGKVIHHIDGNKLNNNIKNLKILIDPVHRRMELSKTKNGLKWKIAVKKLLGDRNKSIEMRKISSDTCKINNKIESFKLKHILGRYNIFLRKKFKIKYHNLFNYINKLSKIINVEINDIIEKYFDPIFHNILLDNFLNYTNNIKDTKQLLPDNHKILKIEELNYTEDVYCLTVPEHGNFALDSGVFVSNCAGWSLRQLIMEGLGGVEAKISSAPAKHLTTLVNQMVNFIGILQNEWAGAQAFSSVDTLMAPFVRYDNLSYKEVKQCIQSLMFGLNTPSRWGTQCPFSNITLDWVVPDDLKNQPVIIGGEPQDATYSDFQKEMDMINKAFLELYETGDNENRGFAYPIPTYNITKDFDWDNENAKLLWKITGKFGTPYFQNFVNSDLNPGDVRSMCPVYVKEKVLVRIDGLIDTYIEIDNLSNNEEYLIFSEGRYRKGRFTKYGKQPCYRITLSNNASIVVSDYHENIIHDGYTESTLTTIELLKSIKEKDYYIPFSRNMTDVQINHSEIKDVDPNLVDQFTNRIYYKITNIEYVGKLEVACFEMDGDPSFTLSTGIITHNCRLQLDKRELLKRGGGLFGSNEFTGSIGVVTLNMGRIGYLSKTKEEFFKKISNLMDIAKDSLEIKRKIVKKLYDQGLYPYTRRYLRHFNNHFSTIGLNGMNEGMINFMGKDLSNKDAINFTIEVLNFMRDKLIQYQEETGNLYNLEATPAEGTSYRLAKIDKEKYPDIILSGTDDSPFYTNSTQLPVDFTEDVFEALELQETIQGTYTGGTVFHTFLGEMIEDIEITKKLIQKIVYNYKVPYVTLSPTYSTCPKHGYLTGEVYECPKCGSPTEVYKRIVGYFRNVNDWNKGKHQEQKERVMFNIDGTEKIEKENLNELTSI